jgi:hypothetical protein
LLLTETDVSPVGVIGIRLNRFDFANAEHKNQETRQPGDADAVPTWTAPVVVPLDLADAESGHFGGIHWDGHGCS